jgi:hypothetical protein
MRHRFSFNKIKIVRLWRIFGISFFALLPFSQVIAQIEPFDFTVPPSSGYRCRAEIVGKDTIPVVDLFTIDVCTNSIFKTKRQYEAWTRTKHNVKIVYPYALLAAAKLKEYDLALEKITDEKKRKQFLKACEQNLLEEFEDEIKSLSISQGHVLMKLIDRESNKTTFEIVKQLRGSFQAVFWNTLARLVGNNMKTQFDPAEDIMIERAVQLVELGRI